VKTEVVEVAGGSVASATERDQERRRRRELLLAGLVLTAAFGGILYSVARLSFGSKLHSHLFVMPLVSWFVWRFIDGNDQETPEMSAKRLASSSRGGAIVAALFGLGSVVVYFILRGRPNLPETEWLWAGVLGYLFLLFAAALWTMGWTRLRHHKFALLFLLFAVPLPLAATNLLSQALQYGSAEVAAWTFHMSGLPVLRDDLVFRLPTLSVRVAEECSGVRSTLVLFITSLLAGKMFLRTPWKGAVLALATIPLGLLRNALRITGLSWLAVNVDRSFIDGPLHHHGGPIYFALSLVPLFALLLYFQRSELGSDRK
jgi:exosortase C (VPDSG-CTERM-specific)